MNQKHIAQVTLHNYRSHEHTDIQIGMLTSLIGENDCGKSNVYNGIDMVLTNSTFTESALRYGTKEGWVRVTFHDGTWIERHRSGSKQRAVIFDGKRTAEYTTIKDLGAIVEEFTGFKPVVLDKQAKAESVQLVPIDAGQNFMVVGSSPEVVNRRIMRLMHGAGIETAKIQLEKEMRQLKNQAEVDRKAYEKSDQLVKILEDDIWDVAGQELDTVENMVKELRQLDGYYAAIDAVYDSMPEQAWLISAKALMTEIDEMLQTLSELIEQSGDGYVDVRAERDAIFAEVKTLEANNQALIKVNNDIKTLEAQIAQEEEAEKQKAIAEAVAKKTVEPARAAVETPASEPKEDVVDAPINLVLDTIDCLEAFKNRKDEDKTIALADEIAEDWRKLCPAS